MDNFRMNCIIRELKRTRKFFSRLFAQEWVHEGEYIETANGLGFFAPCDYTSPLLIEPFHCGSTLVCLWYFAEPQRNQQPSPIRHGFPSDFFKSLSTGILHFTPRWRLECDRILLHFTSSQTINVLIKIPKRHPNPIRGNEEVEKLLNSKVAGRFKNYRKEFSYTKSTNSEDTDCQEELATYTSQSRARSYDRLEEVRLLTWALFIPTPGTSRQPVNGGKFRHRLAAAAHGFRTPDHQFGDRRTLSKKSKSSV